MGSRERILAGIKSTKSNVDVSLQYTVSGIVYGNRKAQFEDVLTSIGGRIMEARSSDVIKEYVSSQIEAGKKVIDVTVQTEFNCSANELYLVDTAVVNGSVAVAENGAIWISEKQMGYRLLPFSCKELVIIIHEQDIINNMQEAYDLIDIASEGYGVFISGPSKTADIEQSLVIGAHGPIELLVIIKKYH